VLKDPRANRATRRGDHRTRVPKDVSVRPDPRKVTAFDTQFREHGKQQPRQDDVLVNCAGCTIELAVDAKTASRCGLERLAGRSNERPYCKDCLPGVRGRL